jgi:pimeloyl-ACP methyl ester carboxylesterase
MSKDIHALMEHLVTGPVILAGQAMGGLVALAYARAFPRLVRGLVLVGMKDWEDKAVGTSASEAGKLCVPTLVIAGADDAFAPHGESFALAHSIPGAQFVLIPNAGHLVAFEQPAAFNQIMRHWLAWGSQGLEATCP